MKPCPIFILAPIWRSGSTLVQRILNTGDDLVIWGENHGLISHFANNYTKLQHFAKSGIDGKAHVHFNEERGRDSSNLWLANTNPPGEHYLSCAKDFIESYYKLYSDRWGFKEVRYGKKEVELLCSLFPNARFIFVVRDIIDCYRSTKTLIPYEIKNIGGISSFVTRYEKNADFFHNFYSKNTERCLLFRFEDIKQHLVEKLCAFAEISVSDYTLEVFNTPISKLRRKVFISKQELDILSSVKSRRLFGYV